ncbi:unnamed protein product [Linum trigynum]|uniref:F-box associated beta-propeller type 1 domain-containing protein n=1 Tax=Linum trigynum TaxID=586398 RepID=A0AAV2FFC4_9ROSI
MKEAIPEDIAIAILWRLPVGACIARFCCVQKTWYHLLSDPSFITQKLSSSGSEHQIMIKRYTSQNSKSPPIYTLHSPDTLEPLTPSAGLPLPFFDPAKPRHPKQQQYFEIEGYCHGLFCIFDHAAERLILWNPATSETKIPPPSSIYNPYDYTFHAAWFGFDSQTNDYKVMQLLIFHHDGVGCYSGLVVYSLRHDSWRKFDGDHFPVKSSRQIPQFRKGKLYWWSWGVGLRFDSLDMTSEVFQHVHVTRVGINRDM